MKTLIVGNSLESFLTAWELSGSKGQDVDFVCPRLHAGNQPLLGHRLARDSKFMRNVLNEFDIQFDDEFSFESGILKGDAGEPGILSPLGDQPLPHLAFDNQLLIHELLEFISPTLLDSATLVDLHWDPEAQEADLCLRYFDRSSNIEHKVFDFDACVLDCSLEGQAVPNGSFRNNFQVLRIHNAEFRAESCYRKVQRFDMIHVDRKLGSNIDKFHTHGELTTVFFRDRDLTLEQIQDELAQFIVDPNIYDWNNKPVALPHVLSACRPGSAHFVPLPCADLSVVESISQHIVSGASK